MKANTSLSGPNDDVEKPRGSTELDWEVEIAAIIGTRAKYVTEPTRSNMSPAIASATTYPNAISSSSDLDNGRKASRTTLLGRSVRGW